MNVNKEVKPEDNKTEWGKIVDMSEEEFKAYIRNFNLGETNSYYNLMCKTYQDVLTVKEQFIKKFKSTTDTEVQEDCRKAITNAYGELFKIEIKCCILKKRANTLKGALK